MRTEATNAALVTILDLQTEDDDRGILRAHW